jgi:hypothetical protein
VAKRVRWYPDPNDSDSELYWDGGGWHGRRPEEPARPYFTPTPLVEQGGRLGCAAPTDPIRKVGQTVAWGLRCHLGITLGRVSPVMSAATRRQT